MTKQLLPLLMLVFFIESCNSGFSVKGKIEHMPEQKFRIEELGTERNILVDSGKTSKDGQFSIDASATEESLFRIRFEQGKYILLALKNGDKAVVAGDWNQLENYTVSGSSGSIALKSFLINLRENIKDIQTMQVILDSISAQPKNDSLKQMAIEDLKRINGKPTVISSKTLWSIYRLGQYEASYEYLKSLVSQGKMTEELSRYIEKIAKEKDTHLSDTEEDFATEKEVTEEFSDDFDDDFEFEEDSTAEEKSDDGYV